MWLDEGRIRPALMCSSRNAIIFGQYRVGSRNIRPLYDIFSFSRIMRWRGASGLGSSLGSLSVNTSSYSKTYFSFSFVASVRVILVVVYSDAELLMSKYY